MVDARADSSLQQHFLKIVHRYAGEAVADAEYRLLLDKHANDSALWHYYALFLREIGEVPRAQDAIQRAIALNPGSRHALLLAAILSLESGTPDLALFDNIGNSDHYDVGAKTGFAAALAAAGRSPAALAFLDTAIAADPEEGEFLALVDARTAICQQTSGAAEGEKFLQRMVLAQPGNPGVMLKYLNYIWRAQGASVALEKLQQSFIAQTTSGQVMEAELRSEVGDIAEAERLYVALRDAFDRGPAIMRMARVRHNFRSGKIETAGGEALSIGRQANLIEAWAHVELAWRALGDPRWSWLTRDGALARYDALEGFAGYKEELISLLRQLHGVVQHAPLEQSPRNGTQTDGHLLRRSEEVIGEFREDLRRVAKAYISDAQLNAEEDHPLSRLATMTPYFVGSWSVRLTEGGHNAPHFHNQGLLSSACHLLLPKQMLGANPAGEGQLEFGKPPASLGLDLPAFARVIPQEGHFALFPSYFFHSVTQVSGGERLVVACDIAAV